jgi:outer membrane receptor protein involved in Fe transport
VHGQVPGYAVLNLDARWKISKGLELFGRVDNVFNRKYANFGVLGSNAFANPTKTFDPANAAAEPFYGLGAPRGA